MAFRPKMKVLKPNPKGARLGSLYQIMTFHTLEWGAPCLFQGFFLPDTGKNASSSSVFFPWPPLRRCVRGSDGEDEGAPSPDRSSITRRDFKKVV